MNAFLTTLERQGIGKDILMREQLTTLQVNLGNLCNQSCGHCHIEASPQGKKLMPRRIIDNVLEFLPNNRGLTLDVTGGAPELNPNFDYLIGSACNLVKEIIVRTNLTVFFELGKEYLPNFFKENNVHLICSLPCYTKENVDRQRGKGVFEKSIKALLMLNKLGFGKDNGLCLDLVYNPGGASLPTKQDQLERDYKQVLGKNYGIFFNRLLTISNVPIKRFKKYLETRKEYDNYVNLLKNNFNPKVLENLMCRSLLNVGYDGKLYDCDFNQKLNLALENAQGNPLIIDQVKISEISDKEIIFGEHCFACSAGFGSSCQGALENVC